MNGAPTEPREVATENPAGPPGMTTGRANPCTGHYILRLYCCAPNDVVLNEACNEPGEFTGSEHRDATDAAKAAGWRVHVAGIAAWCPKHAGRTFDQRCTDFAERAACTAPDPDDCPRREADEC